MSDTTIDEAAVQNEHLAEVHVGMHWAYIAGVLIGSTLLMLGFIALLGR